MATGMIYADELYGRGVWLCGQPCSRLRAPVPILQACELGR